MPNWVENRLSYNGNETEIKEMLEKIRYDNATIGTIDFNKIIPMPKSLDIECGSRTDKGIEMVKNYLENLPAELKGKEGTYEEILEDLHNHSANLTDDDGKNNNGAFAGNILDRKYQRESGHEAAYYPPSGSHSGTRHGGYIYKELADAFPMIDGKPIDNSQYTFDPLNPAQNRDPRFNNTVIYDGALVPADDTYSATTVVNTWIGVGQTSDAVYQGTATGFYVRKGCDRLCKGSTWNPSRHNDPLIRYADILLMYAEAANEYHGPDFEETLGGQQLGCYPILKLIRKRAGIEPGADGMYGLEKNMTQKQMRQAIQEERRLEFAFEGHRFFDVRRWMIAPQTESKTMHGIEITRATDGTKTWKEFDVRTHPAMYFFPIPYNETVKSKDLLQNPYYN